MPKVFTLDIPITPLVSKSSYSTSSWNQDFPDPVSGPGFTTRMLHILPDILAKLTVHHKMQLHEEFAMEV